MELNALVLVLAAEAFLPWGLALSAIVGVILGVTSRAGGELSCRHRIGVTPNG